MISPRVTFCVLLLRISRRDAWSSSSLPGFGARETVFFEEETQHVVQSEVDLSTARWKVLGRLEGSTHFGVDEPDKFRCTHTRWIVETISGVHGFKIKGTLIVEEMPRRGLPDTSAKGGHQFGQTIEIDDRRR